MFCRGCVVVKIVRVDSCMSYNKTISDNDTNNHNNYNHNHYNDIDVTTKLIIQVSCQGNRDQYYSNFYYSNVCG